MQYIEYTIPTPGQEDGAMSMEALFRHVQAHYPRRDIRCANGTGYLDEHLADHCGVTWGVDDEGRPHITISFQKLTRSLKWMECTVTLFRRYGGEGSPWTLAVNRGNDHDLVAAAVTEGEAVRLWRLVRVGSVNVPRDNPYYPTRYETRYELLH